MTRLLMGSLALLMMAAGVLIFVVVRSADRSVAAGSDAESESVTVAPGARAPAAPAEWMTNYTLTERSGKKFASSDLQGKVHVVNFFFSKCPTSCRQQTAAVKLLAEEYGPQGVVFLSITCDPANDTPTALALYAKEFNADPEQWLFLTGDLNYLRRVGAEMYFLPVDVGTHSEMLVVLDKWGQIRNRFSWKDAAQVGEMRQYLDELLAETVRPDVKS